MISRATQLSIPFWSTEELLFIAKEGFRVLGVVDVDTKLATVLARESYGSPHLMQKFCRELCKLNDIREAQITPVNLSAPPSWGDFFAKQLEPVSIEWLERILSGPKERGNQRTQWPLKGGKTLDGYGIVLRAIVELGFGPDLKVSKDEIRTKVDELVSGSGPAPHQMTRYLQRMSQIAGTRRTDPVPSEDELATEGDEREVTMDLQPVLEYVDHDPHSTLHIADPFFAFCLRWRSPKYLHNAPPEV